MTPVATEATSLAMLSTSCTILEISLPTGGIMNKLYTIRGAYTYSHA